MTFLRIVISALSYWWSMIFSENRHPLFGIMLYSGSMRAALTMSAHFFVSETTNARSTSGVLVSGSTPAESSVSCTALSASAAFIAALSLSTMAFGVLAGKNAANQAV